MATPFLGNIFIFTQPDGSTLRVRGWGDQHYAVFETLDGYTVMKNPETGFWDVAQLSPDRAHLEPMPDARSRPDGAFPERTLARRQHRPAAPPRPAGAGHAVARHQLRRTRGEIGSVV